MLVPPKKSSWIPWVSECHWLHMTFFSFSVHLEWLLLLKSLHLALANRFPVKYSLVTAHPLLIPSANAMACPSFHMWFPASQVERMKGISKQSTCLWSNPIIADLVESKIQRSQSAVCWNPNSPRIKTYLRCPSCCILVWEWRFEFCSSATLTTKRPSDDCNPRLAVIVNLPIVSTDGVFEGKKRQGVRTTEPRHSARQQQALGVLVPAEGHSLESALLWRA